jgi:hypothetical protein
VPPASRLPVTRRQLALAGASVLALVVLIAVVASGGGKHATTGGSGSGSGKRPGSSAVQPGDDGDAAGDVVARANELLAAGRREAALDVALVGRKSYPDDARIAYVAGQILFAKLYWSDGLKQLRDAIRLDPHYRDDPELIKTVLRGFNTTPRYNDELADFLHDEIGAAARPLLEETANGHPNPTIRARAADELRRYR